MTTNKRLPADPPLELDYQPAAQDAWLAMVSRWQLDEKNMGVLLQLCRLIQALDDLEAALVNSGGPVQALERVREMRESVSEF